MVLPNLLVSQKQRIVQFLIIAMLMVLSLGGFEFPARANTQVAQASSPPIISRVSPSTPVTVFVGHNNFTAKAEDTNCNLQGSEWYVNGQFQGATYYSGCSATTWKVLVFQSPGNYLVEVNAFASDGTYSAPPAPAWIVTVVEHIVVNQFIQTDATGFELGDISNETSDAQGLYITRTYPATQYGIFPSTGDLLVGSGLTVGGTLCIDPTHTTCRQDGTTCTIIVIGSPTCIPYYGEARLKSTATIGDRFRIIHNSLYKLSWYYQAQALLTATVTGFIAGGSRAEGSLAEAVVIFRDSDNKVVWDSGDIVVHDESFTCLVGLDACIEATPVQPPDIFNIQHSLSSPWLALSEGTYRWGAYLKAEVAAKAAVGATAQIDFWAAPLPGLGGKLVDFAVEDSCQDHEPPTSMVLLSGMSGESSWYRSPISVTLGATDGPTSTDCSQSYGVDSTFYRVDGGSWSIYSIPFNITGDGRHKLEFYSTDKAGNIENQKAVDIFIDSSPPAGVLHISNDGVFTSTRFVSLVASATDGTQGSGDIQMIFRNSGGIYSDWMPYSTGLISWSLVSGDGDKGVCVQFKDAAGNIGAEYCRHIFLDTTPPSIPNPKAQAMAKNSTLTFSWAPSTDAGSGVAGYVWRVDAGNEMFTTATSVNVPSLVGERHVFYLRAEDNGGLLSSWGSVPFGANAPSTPTSLLASMLNSSPLLIFIPGVFAAALLGVIAYRKKIARRLSKRC